MALRHAVLAALLDEELSGYQLAKQFDAGVANFWHAQPQQVYAELAKLEEDGLVAGREVVQESRPNKRLFRVTDPGLDALRCFAATPAKPTFVRDDLLVAVQAADHLGTADLIARLEQRAAFAQTRAELFEGLLRTMRGNRAEEDFPAARQTDRPLSDLPARSGLRAEQPGVVPARTAAVLRDRDGTSEAG